MAHIFLLQTRQGNPDPAKNMVEVRYLLKLLNFFGVETKLDDQIEIRFNNGVLKYIVLLKIFSHKGCVN